MKFLILFFLCLKTLTRSQNFGLAEEVPAGLANVNTVIPVSKFNKMSESPITDGEIVAEGAAPWQVSLQNENGKHYCGAAIINNKYLLTAASCVADLDKHTIKAVTGTNNWTVAAGEYFIEDVIIHCHFYKSLYLNDVALLKVNTSIVFNDKTKNITLADLDLLEDGEILTMTGWGDFELGGDYSTQLKKSNVTVISNEVCQNMYDLAAGDVSEGQLCVVAGNYNGVSHGDTGGPIVNIKNQLVGIINQGAFPTNGKPWLNAKASYYHDWIRTTIRGCNLKSL